MRRLDLDLARSHPLLGGLPRPTVMLCALLLLAGAGLAVQATLRWSALQDEVAQLQQRAARQGVRPPAPTGPNPGQSAATPAARPMATQLAQRGAPIDEETRRELDNARQILTQLALPWEPLFGAIEAALTRDTALLAIEPDAAKGMVRLSGEARNYPAILVLMRRLEQPVAGHGVVLSGVHLLSHDVRDDVPERPLRYTVAARWSTGP
jgi:hypothetical protein